MYGRCWENRGERSRARYLGWQWTFLSSILALWEQTLRARRVLSLSEASLLKLDAENQARPDPRESPLPW